MAGEGWRRHHRPRGRGPVRGLAQVRGLARVPGLAMGSALALGAAAAFLLTLPAGASTARHVLAEAFTATW